MMNRRLPLLALPVLVALGVAVSSPSVADAPLTDSTGRFTGEARVGNTLTSAGFFNTASDPACSENVVFQGSGSYTIPAAELGRYVFVNIIGTGRGDCVGPIAAAVQPSEVSIYRVNPVDGSISVRSTVSFYATVTIGGEPAPSGTPVQGFAKSKLVVTGKVNSSGKVKLTLPGKLPAGKATLKAVVPGSPSVTTSSDSVAVRVSR